MLQSDFIGNSASGSPMPAIGSGEKGAGSTFPISASVTKAPMLLLFYCTSARSVLVWFLIVCIIFFFFAGALLTQFMH